jgi:hypothetical protein
MFAIALASFGAAASTSRAQDEIESEGSNKISFQTLLQDAGVTDEQFAPFAAWSGAVDAAEASTISQILFRLAQFDREEAPSNEQQPGSLNSVEGLVRSMRRLELPANAPADLRETGLFECTLEQADGVVVTVLSSQLPAAWLKRTGATELAEPASLRGVRLGEAERDGAPTPLLLTNHIAWRPTTGVPAGTAWLAAQGFDAALLDDVRQNRPFAKPNESAEAEAFYTALAVLAAGDAAELRELARESVAAEAKRREALAASAAERQRQLQIELESVLPERQQEIEEELTDLRRRQSMAAQVGKRASLGLSSVAPMFNEPADSAGKFFVINGIARRAVRIVVDQKSAALVAEDEAAAPLTHYYELDVFPTDGQNNPVICCVARLPAGFPTGDLIREPVRVAGIFFKKWAYARRPDPDGSATSPERIAPPLMLAAEPEWLESAPAPRGDRGWWAGLAILAASLIVALVLWRTACRDRLARQRLARYDGPLDDLLEPK